MEVKTIGVSVLKKQDDPDGITRVSVGGDIHVGIYCVYRGSKEEAIAALTVALEGLRVMAATLGREGKDEPDVDPDDVIYEPDLRGDEA